MAAKRAAKERSTAPTTSAEHHFYVTRDSQDADKNKPDSQKLSYVGMRDLTDLDMIDEQDILSASGTIRGKKNRVRAGLANFENPKALEKVTTSYLCAKRCIHKKRVGLNFARLFSYFSSTQSRDKWWCTSPPFAEFVRLSRSVATFSTSSTTCAFAWLPRTSTCISSTTESWKRD